MKKLRWFFSAAVLMLLLLAFPALRQGERILGADIANISILQQYGENYVLKIERHGEFATVYRNLSGGALGQYLEEFDEAALAKIEAALAEWKVPEVPEKNAGSGKIAAAATSDAALEAAPAEVLTPEIGRRTDGTDGEAEITILIGFTGGSRTVGTAHYAAAPTGIGQYGGSAVVSGGAVWQESIREEPAEKIVRTAPRSGGRHEEIPLPRPAAASTPVRMRTIVWALVWTCPGCILLWICRKMAADRRRGEFRVLRKAGFRPRRVYSPGISSREGCGEKMNFERNFGIFSTGSLWRKFLFLGDFYGECGGTLWKSPFFWGDGAQKGQFWCEVIHRDAVEKI